MFTKNVTWFLENVTQFSDKIFSGKRVTFFGGNQPLCRKTRSLFGGDPFHEFLVTSGLKLHILPTMCPGVYLHCKNLKELTAPLKCFRKLASFNAPQYIYRSSSFKDQASQSINFYFKLMACRRVLFPRSWHQFTYQLSKNTALNGSRKVRNHSLQEVTTHAISNHLWHQLTPQAVVNCNEWLLIATNVCELRVVALVAGFFLKVGIHMSRPGQRKVPLSFCLLALSFKLYLYNCEADPLSVFYYLFS